MSVESGTACWAVTVFAEHATSAVVSESCEKNSRALANSASSSCWLHDGAPPQPAAASWFLEAGAEGPRCATARLAALKPSVNGEAVVTQAALQANATNAALRGQMEALFSLMQARPEELAPDAEEAAEAARLDARAALEKLLGRAQRGALRVER